MKNHTGTFGPYFLFLCAFFMLVFSTLSALGWLTIGCSFILLALTVFLNPDFYRKHSTSDPISIWLILALCVFGISWVYTLTLQNGNAHPLLNLALASIPTAVMGGVILKHSAHKNS